MKRLLSMLAGLALLLMFAAPPVQAHDGQDAAVTCGHTKHRQKKHSHQKHSHQRHSHQKHSHQKHSHAKKSHKHHSRHR